MAARKLPSAEAIAKKMVDRTSGAGGAWESGMRGAAGSITSNMKAASKRYKDEMTKALAEGRWDKAIANLTDDQIIAAAIKTGGGGWETAISNKAEKVAAAWRILQPRLQAHMDKIAAMPNGSDAEREQRMVENLRGMRKLGLA